MEWQGILNLRRIQGAIQGGTLFLGILALTLATYRNTAGLVKAPDVRSASEEAGLLRALQEEVRALAERQKRVEEKVAAVSDR